jgi:methylated-DNA-[protein]-cysteine S-methyltransferase
MTPITSFRNQVYAVVRSIPAGTVMTYGQVAAAAGNPKAARAVGAIMRTNPKSFLNAINDPEVMPCHRVVAADQQLGGFNGGSTAKQRLLIAEGWTITSTNKVLK